MADDLPQVSGSSASTESKPSVLLLIAVTATWTLSQMSYYAQSQLLGPLMSRFEMGETSVGQMFSQEVFVFAITGLFLAGPLSRISRVRVAMFGGVILVAANFVSSYTDSFQILSMARIMAGFAGGMIGAAGMAAAASAANPQRVFATVSVAWGVASALQIYVMPILTDGVDAAAGFYGMAVAGLVILPCVMWLLPPRQSETDLQAALSTSIESLSIFARFAERLGVRDAPNRALALTAMLGIAIYEVGQGSVYIMYEQIGLRSGLEVQEIGEAVGGATLIGLLGGLLALWMGNRFGSARPIVIGITLNVVAASGLAICEDATAYFWLQLLWLFAYAFVLPYVLGVLADMDDKGRWVVAMDAVWWLGDAPGPWVGGWLVESGGYNRLAVLPIVTGVVCVVLFVWLLRRLKVIQEQSPVSGNAGI